MHDDDANKDDSRKGSAATAPRHIIVSYVSPLSTADHDTPSPLPLSSR